MRWSPQGGLQVANARVVGETHTFAIGVAQGHAALVRVGPHINKVATVVISVALRNVTDALRVRVA